MPRHALITRFIACAMTVWMVLHGLTVWSMPLCQHDHPAVNATGDSVSDHCQSRTQSENCQDCAGCHLAGTPALPAAMPASAPTSTAPFVEAAVTPPRSHTPERAHPPPLRA